MTSVVSTIDIICMTWKVVKGSVIAHHFTDHTIEDYKPLNFDLLDEDMLTVEDDSEMND